MTAFPKYTAYKASGVEWLGEVPDHWEANRVFSIFNERVETGHSQLPILNITISNGVQVEQFEGDRKKRLIEDRDAYKRAAAGDIAYNTMRMWQGAVGDVPVDGLVSPAYVVARPIKSINSRYYSYLFRGETFQVETNRHSYGIVSDRNRLYWLGFKNIVVPIPPRAEQERIGAFLDEKTAQIDALIAKKQRQIELLDEQKAILINRAVTRGLHPNPDLQDSGIPWIGPIPKHWRPVALRRLVLRIEQGVSPSTVEGEVGPQDWGVLKSGCTNGGVFRETEHKRLPKRFKIDPSIVVRSGDLLVSRACGSRDLVASTALVEDLHFNLILSDKNFRLVLGDAVLPRFLCHSMNSWHYRRQIEPRISGAEGLPNNIPSSRLVEVVIPLPDLEEQKAVVAHLDSLHDSFNKLTQQFESQIQTLQTLRSTLIAHAVTGKIAIPAATA